MSKTKPWFLACVAAACWGACLGTWAQNSAAFPQPPANNGLAPVSANGASRAGNGGAAVPAPSLPDASLPSLNAAATGNAAGAPPTMAAGSGVSSQNASSGALNSFSPKAQIPPSGAPFNGQKPAFAGSNPSAPPPARPTEGVKVLQTGEGATGAEGGTSVPNIPLETTLSGTNPSPGSLPYARVRERGSDPQKNLHEEQVAREAHSRLQGDLNQYCGEFCTLLSTYAQAEEVFDPVNADLGFESLKDFSAQRRFRTVGIQASIMVDAQFGQNNFEKLKNLMGRLVQNYPHTMMFQWNRVSFPDSGSSLRTEAELRAEGMLQVRDKLESLVSSFCPRECLVQDVDVRLARATVEDIRNGNLQRAWVGKSGQGTWILQSVRVQLSMDSGMEAERQERISKLIRDTLQAYGNTQVHLNLIPFPKAGSEVQKDRDDERADPFGVQRLAALLKIMRDYSSTKEIIRENSSSTNTSSLQNSETQKDSRHDSTNVNSSETSHRSSENHSSQNSETSQNEKSNATQLSEAERSQNNTTLWWALGGFVLVVIVVGGLVLRHMLNGPQMRSALNQAGYGGGMGEAPLSAIPTFGVVTPAESPVQVHTQSPRAALSDSSGTWSQKLVFQGLKDEMMQILITQPRVARDVFGRMLREDGIEQAAKYVCIFGEMVVFELLGDTDMKSEINTLAEYIHVNTPSLSDEDQMQLLKNLKLRLTAGKMRQLTNTSLDAFDFLKSKSPRQIYEIVQGESTRTQGVVLTQLNTEKRKDVFELFEGQSKLELLRELAHSGGVTREYMQNVADALQRKAKARPDFEGETLKGTDVLLDLLEHASLDEQKGIMADLDGTNPEVARMVRTRLVTVETLTWLRDGLLIEIFLSLEPHQMAIFLAGISESMRGFILSKAPRDIAQNWLEGMEGIRSIDPEAFRLSQMQVVHKVRQFASGGMINLLEINTALYPSGSSQTLSAQATPTEVPEAHRKVFRIGNPLVA